MRDRRFLRFPVHRGIGLAALAVAATLLDGCASPPATHWYSLMPSEVVARSGAPAAAGITFVLEPIRLPTQVDQPQWLVQLADGSVALLEQERWASPLRDEFRQALLEELVDGQGAVEARTQPAPAGAPWRIGLDVRRFDSLPGSEARVQGSWTLAAGDARTPSSRCEWLLREPAPGGFAALAAAHRHIVARLGQDIAQALAQARRGESAACPPPDERR